MDDFHGLIPGGVVPTRDNEATGGKAPDQKPVLLSNLGAGGHTARVMGSFSRAHQLEEDA
jgi:hypothetical protein